MLTSSFALGFKLWPTFLLKLDLTFLVDICEGYVYKLFDILYFNYIKEEDIWGTDVMPEYKLMVKNDAFIDDFMDKACEEYNKVEEKRKNLYW